MGQGADRHRKGDMGDRVVYVKVPSLCVSPVLFRPGGAGAVRAVVFMPHRTRLPDGTDIGGYTATVSIPEKTALSLSSESQALLGFDRTDSIRMSREGSPPLTVDPYELMIALRKRREAAADEAAKRAGRRPREPRRSRPSPKAADGGGKGGEAT